MGWRKIYFIFVFLFLCSTLFIFQYQSNEIKVLEPKIEFFDCSEQNYKNTDFLDVKNIQTFLKNEDFFEGNYDFF